MQHNTLALLDAASRASELAALTPKRNAGRLWAPHEAEALRKGVEKYGMGAPSPPPPRITRPAFGYAEE